MKITPYLLVLTAVVFANVTLCSKAPTHSVAKLNQNEIPQRTDIVTGKLPNGLRYVLKTHNEPRNTISLRMHIASGSLNESESQKGLAHFLEHIAFSGSTNFPDESATAIFEELGMQFAVHQNAVTSFNSTNYKLELPNNSEKLAALGLLFFADILDRLTFDEKAIERERRGIILEEKRNFDMVPGNKQAEAWRKRFLAGSLYSKRLPIGTEERILSFKKEDFLNYYRTFYRTDNTTIVMVGDMDTAIMLRIIEEQFGSIQPRSVVIGNDKSIPSTKKISAYIEKNPNIKSPQLTIACILPPQPFVRTISEVEQKIVSVLAEGMMASRIDLEAVITRENILNACECVGLDITNDELSWKDMLYVGAKFLNQARRYGFSKKELARGKKDLITHLQKRANIKASARILADEFVEFVDEGRILTSNSELLELHIRLIENITLKQINNWWKKFQLNPYIVKLTLPPSVNNIPRKKTVLATVKKALKKKVPRYKSTKASKVATLFKDPIPDPAPISDITHYQESQITSILLENGVRVNFRNMDVPTDDIKIRVTLPGGKIEETNKTPYFTTGVDKSYELKTSTLSKADIDELSRMHDIHVYFDCYEDCVEFNCSVKQANIEILFQLLHKLINEPQINSNKFKTWKQKKVHTEPHRVRTLEKWADLTLSELTLQPSEVRLKTPQSLDEIKNLKSQDCQEWLQRIFSQAPIGISIVGKINAQTITKLAQTYFGTLSSRPEISAATLSDCRNMAIKPGPFVTNVIRSCETEASFVVAGYTASVSQGPVMTLLDIIVAQRLMNKARVDERLIYSIDRAFKSDAIYLNYGYYLIKASCSPENQNRLADIIDEIFHNLSVEGPSDKELAAAKKTADHNDSYLYVEEYRGVLWLSILDENMWRKDPNDTVKTMMKTGVEIRANYEKVSQEDIKALMQKIIKPENHVRIIVQGQKQG